jgi:glutathione peroxidase
MRSALARVLAVLTLPLFSFAQSGASPATAPRAGEDDKPLTSVLDAVVKDIDDQEVPLRKFEGDVLLIVNVATRCGLTAQNYAEFEPLYQKYKDRGFRILAFPCNDFGGQEPGTHDEIKSFCRSTHHGTYDLFAKVSVKGETASPLYKYLTTHPDEKIRGEVRWNFQKYLVGRDGTVLEKFDPRIAPNDAKLGEAIEKALQSPRPAKKQEPSAPSKSG